jgi:1-deoxy-D-xylulose-5-phosphate reductoisomerase
MKTELQPLDLTDIGTLSFFEPDEERFPATRLAREAAQAGGAAPAVLNAANEVAVAAFLAGQIAFTDICALVAQALDEGNLPPAPLDLAEVLDLDWATRKRVARMLEHV